MLDAGMEQRVSQINAMMSSSAAAKVAVSIRRRAVRKSFFGQILEISLPKSSKSCI
jgi:hypothetical protein